MMGESSQLDNNRSAVIINACLFSPLFLSRLVYVRLSVFGKEGACWLSSG